MEGTSSASSHDDIISWLLRPSTPEADAEYFQTLCQEIGGNVSVRQHPCQEKGRALFTQTAVTTGDIVCIEKPLFSQQDFDNRSNALICSYCLKHAGSVVDQLHWYLLNKASLTEQESRLMQLIEDGEIELPQFDRLLSNDVVYCDCGAVFCSEECKEEAVSSYHRFLCTKRTSAEKPTGTDVEHLRRFSVFCEQTNPSFFLVAKALVTCVNTFCSMDSDQSLHQRLQTAWNPLWHAWKPLWWDCVSIPDDVTDANAFKNELLELAGKASVLLQEGIQLPATEILFSPKMVGATMGIIEQNNITVSIPSPLECYIDHLNEADDAFVGSLWERYAGLKETLLNAAQFSAEGSGYYPVICCANHSCSPNAQSVRRDGIDLNHMLILVATEDISVGEEITISYIDENVPYVERVEALRDYGFQCSCPKCEAKQ